MGRLSRHLGVGEKLVIEGQEYAIKTLTIKELPLLFKLAKYLDNNSTKDGEALLKSLPPEGAQVLVDIVMITLKRSFPEETEEDLSEFGMKYMNELFPLIMNINATEKSDDAKKRDALLERIRQNGN